MGIFGLIPSSLAVGTMRLTRFSIIALLLALASPAIAQSGCGGQFPANQFCGTGGSQGLPGPRLIPAGGTTPIGGGTVLGNNGTVNALPSALTVPVLGIPGTSTGTLGFGGITSGTATITPQATAGTPTLTLPNTSGTLAAGASAPLVLNATTGNLTCPTCALLNAANTFTAGPQTIAPPSNTLTQGLIINQTGPNSGTTAGPFEYNRITCADGNNVFSGSSRDAFDLLTGDASCFRVNYTMSADNVNPRLAGTFAINYTGTSTVAQPVALIGSVYTNIQLQSMWGVIGYTSLGPTGITQFAFPVVSEVSAQTGSTVTYRSAFTAYSEAPVQGSTLDSVLTVTAQNMGRGVPGGFKNVVAISANLGGATALDTAANFFSSDQAITIANFANLSNATITGNIFNFPNFIVNGNGGAVLSNGSTAPPATGLQIKTSSSNAMVVSANNSLITGAFTVDTSNGSGNGVYVYSTAAASAANITTVSTGTNENLNINAKGTGTVNIGVASVGSPSTGGLNVQGVVNVLTGITQGTMTAGRGLRSNGTNFVSAQFSCADLSTPCITANQTITLSGDVTGSGTTAITTTLATVNSNVGSFGGATSIPVITVNGKGLITAVSTATPTVTAVNGVSYPASFTSGGIPYASSTSAISSSAVMTLNGVIYGGGAGASPLVTAQGAANTVLTANAGAPSFSAAPVIGTSVTTPIHYGGSATGSTATINGTSNGSPSSAFLNLQSNGQFTSIGNTTPKTYLDLNENLSSSPALVVSTSTMRIQGVDGANSGQEWVNYGGAAPAAGSGNILAGVVAAGTSATPLVTGTGGVQQSMFNLRGYGYNGAAFALGSIIVIRNDSLWSGTNQATAIDFYTTPTTSTTVTRQMILQPSGGLSLNTTSDPGAGSLQVNATIVAPNLASDAGLTDTTLCWKNSATTGTFLKGSGTLGICLGTSGAQFKTAFAPMIGGLDEVTKLHLQNYRYKNGFVDSGERMQYGLTAQDVETVLPDLVRHDEMGVAVNYDAGALLFIGLRAIQQLKADNDNLETRLTKLENRK